MNITLKKYILFLSMVTVFLYCTRSEKPTIPKWVEHKITFELDGGLGIETMAIHQGAIIKTPDANPIKEGYIFEGWFSDAKRRMSFSFGERSYGDIVIYAKWKQAHPIKLNINQEDGEQRELQPYETMYKRENLTIVPVISGEEASNSYTYSWKIDGVEVASTPEFTYTPDPSTFGLKELSLEMRSGGVEKSSDVHTIFVPKKRKYKIVGYYSGRYAGKAGLTQFKMDRITHLILCWAHANEANDDIELTFFGSPVDGVGHGRTTTKDDLREVVLKLHEAGVYTVLGFNGTAEFFLPIMMDENARKKFIANVVKMVKEYNIDGVDYDYEALWDNHVWARGAQLSNLIEETRKALPPHCTLSIATYPGGSPVDAIRVSARRSLDMVNIMTYDASMSLDRGPHAPISLFETGTNNWVKFFADDPKKVVNGVPFYAHVYSKRTRRSFNTWGVNTIFENFGQRFPNLVDMDRLDDGVEAEKGGNIYDYNGRPTLRAKAKHIKEKKAGGIMIWELTNDIDDSRYSLLDAIYQELEVNP